MIDLQLQYFPGIDYGSPDMEESIHMALNAYNYEIRNIVPKPIQ